MLFKYLHDRNPRLSKVTSRSGPSFKVCGSSFRLGSWEIVNSTTFECVLSERNDSARTGKFKTTCTTVSELENEWLQARQDKEFGSEARGHELKSVEHSSIPSGTFGRCSGISEALRVAWMGPTPYDQWNSQD